MEYFVCMYTFMGRGCLDLWFQQKNDGGGGGGGSMKIVGCGGRSCLFGLCRCKEVYYALGNILGERTKKERGLLFAVIGFCEFLGLRW